VSNWGIPAPESAKVSWGVRAIYSPPAGIEILFDRQGVSGEDEKERKRLIDWVNKEGLPGLKKILKKDFLGQDERRIVEFKGGGYVLKASPQGSYGYLYVGAWEEEEVTGG